MTAITPTVGALQGINALKNGIQIGGTTFSTGDGTPIATYVALRIGDIYIDYTNGVVYKATATGSASWVILGQAGASASPKAINTVDQIAQASYFSSTAASGTNYGQYVRLDGTGAGEKIATRAKVLLTAAGVGNAHGSHATLELDTSAGSVTGLGTGLRANVVVADRVVAAGTYYGLLAELYGLGATAALPAGSNACLACSVTGGGMEDVANVFAFSCTSGTGHAVYSKGSSITGTMTGWIRVLVNGAVQYMPLYAAAPA